MPSIVCTTSVVEISRETPSRIPASIIASARSAKYAGPEPDSAVTASIACSGTRTTRPRWDSTSSASASCASPACAPAQMPAIPSCTVDGAFGIARTTGTPSAMRASMCAVGIAAATESTVCSGHEQAADLGEQRVDVLRLHRDDDDLRAGDRVRVGGRRLDAVPRPQLLDAALAARGDDELLLRPPAGAEQPGEQRLADASGAEDRDPVLRHGDSLTTRRGVRAAAAGRGRCR